MTETPKGRFTAVPDGPFVVFAVGMRINNFLAVREWLPTARAMGPMLRELYRSPEKGFLGAELFFNLRGPMVLQYWRSFEDLEKFARAPDDPHLPSWRRFNQSARKSGNVGVWHETYSIDAGSHETIYSNMPPFGLARATARTPLGGGGEQSETARSRIEGS